jgi:DNA-binding IclR family transcriptional regulator
MSGTEVVYLDRVEAVWPLGLRFKPGSRVPLHCTSLGKLFLSHLPEDQLRSFVSVLALTRYTQNTITDGKSLATDVAEIRRRGFSVDNQEFMSGVVCVAVPITADDGQLLAGIALSAPEARMTLEQARRYVPMLRDAALKLSETFTAKD